MSVIIERCCACKKQAVRMVNEPDNNDVMTFDLCLDCDDKAHRMLSVGESMATFIRLGGMMQC